MRVINYSPKIFPKNDKKSIVSNPDLHKCRYGPTWNTHGIDGGNFPSLHRMSRARLNEKSFSPSEIRIIVRKVPSVVHPLSPDGLGNGKKSGTSLRRPAAHKYALLLSNVLQEHRCNLRLSQDGQVCAQRVTHHRHDAGPNANIINTETQVIFHGDEFIWQRLLRQGYSISHR